MDKDVKVLYNKNPLTCDICGNGDVKAHSLEGTRGYMVFAFACGHHLIVFVDHRDRVAIEN